MIDRRHVRHSPPIPSSLRTAPIPIDLSRSYREDPDAFATPLRLLSTVALSPLAATLMDLPASVANKRLTFRLSPLDATLTKNQGVGALRSDLPPHALSDPASHLPYTLPSSVSRNPFVCHSYENCGGVHQQFPFRNSPLVTRHSQFHPLGVS